ncbi:CfrBI family restriction endonuclease, partial [Acinetobacter ursingii]
KNGFWLSSQSDERREADATIVFNILGIRVDIVFIGPGNSEITLDKVSRFTKHDEISCKSYHMSTIVIVDT